MNAAEKIIPEVTTTDLIAVESQPALISVNFEEVRTRLETELQKYDVVVTQDTLADAKKLATELNKNASEFDKRRKEAVAKVSGPIKNFETQMKTLVSMCKDGRSRILDQVQKFEDETRAAALSLLTDARADQWNAAGVEPEFQRTEIEDLIKLTALTKAGNLTSGTLNELKNRIAADKQLQDRTSMRLVMLENQSYKAGLSAPLTRDHVNAFLFVDDTQYQASLDRIIASELQRQEQAEAAMRARLEREQAEKHQAELDAQRRAIEAQQKADADVEAMCARKDQEAQHPAEQEQASPVDESPAEAPREPAPSASAAPQPASDPTKTPHAIGVLSDPTAAKIIKCTRHDAFEQAVALELTDPVGVWIPGQLVAIVYGGTVFHKA